MRKPFLFLLLLPFVGIATAAHSQAVIAEDAQSFTTEGFENPAKSVTPPGAAKPAPQDAQQSVLWGYYIYDARTRLYYDDDFDGHYYGIRVVFDADTDLFHADVYARLSLSLEGGPWIPYYTTEVFGINGSSGLDDYVVETELFSGYPTGFYDLRIELFDTYGRRVDVFGPSESSELSFLPLEDQQRDVGGVSSPPVSISRGGGGAPGLAMLFGLTLAALRRR